MPWYGVVLSRKMLQGVGPREYCVQLDPLSFKWELPTGERATEVRRSSRCPDSSPWATVRWELWELAGVWLAWRPHGEYKWFDSSFRWLPQGPGPENAWVFVELKDEEDKIVEPHKKRMWMTKEEFNRHTCRQEHFHLLHKWETLQALDLTTMSWLAARLLVGGL